MIFFPPIILLKSASLGGDLAIPHLQFFGFGVGTFGVSGVAKKFIYNKLFIIQSQLVYFRGWVSLKSDFTLFFTIFSDKIQEICDMIGTRILKIDSENFHFRN